MPEVCEAIYQVNKDEGLSTPQEWRERSQHFGHRWNLHHAVGALNGKHVAIRCPRQSESTYYNYKGFCSVVMLALTTGFCAQIFNECQLRLNVMDGTIGFPDADPLPGDDKDMPYFILTDDVFAWRTWLMKPFRA